MDYFQIDKGEALKRILDELGVSYRRGRQGWQSAHCPNSEAHPHGDRNPSLSLRFDYGKVKCWSCDMHGDWADVALQCRGWKVKEAAARLGLTGDNVVTDKQEYERGDTFLF